MISHPDKPDTPVPNRLTFRPPRNRFINALAAALVIALGLLWRSSLLPLSAFLTKYGGDALWAVVVFLIFGFLFPRAATLRIAMLSLAFAWAIEFLQLYHAPWIDSLRATLPGRLILGNTFNAPDLLAYAIGIILSAVAESAFVKPHQSRPNDPSVPDAAH